MITFVGWSGALLGCIGALLAMLRPMRPYFDQGVAMLILTRRVGETVMIGNDITVTVLGVKGNQVRVGVNAPKEVPVHREEIYERIKREEQSTGARK